MTNKKFENKKVLVIGTGISGIGATRLLKKIGSCPILYDANNNLDIGALRDREKILLDIPIYAGALPKDVEESVDFLVISPGVSIENKMVQSFADRGIEILGEIELAYTFEQGNVIAVTGTNGKTTTTALIGEIMSAYTKDVFVVGNIGNSYTATVSKTTGESVTVAEISSFQLETIHAFRPRVCAILNITPDHLDRHHSLENYINVKKMISHNQTPADTIVLNYEDEATRKIGEKANPKVVYFSAEQKLEDGFYLDADVIYKAVGGESKALLNIKDALLLGKHSYENIMAAIAATDAYGVPMNTIIKVVKAFKAVEHRIEYVATKNGVDFYNDSKGTNVDAAIKGIQAMVKPTFLIGGGYDKGADYSMWIEAFGGKVKELVLIGVTKDAIASCAREHGFHHIVYADSLAEAINHCVKNAVSGDAVLLSPACASWGMFKNYEERGSQFKEIVNQIGEK